MLFIILTLVLIIPITRMWFIGGIVMVYMIISALVVGIKSAFTKEEEK